MDNFIIKPKIIKGSDNLFVDYHIFNAFLVNDQGEVLLLKRDSNNEYFPEHYHVLSGKLEKNESYLDAFMRESIEEVGIELDKESITELGGPVFTKWDSRI
jgi:isopentenyldiphosphate isomerase